MSRMTLELPESLKERLETQAKREGIALHDYLVYSLTRLVTAEDLAHQRAKFETLTHRYPEHEAEAALEEVLATREQSSSDNSAP